MAQVQFIDSDDVTPLAIEHKCEMIIEENRLEQIYNYVKYEFEWAALTTGRERIWIPSAKSRSTAHS
jgi:hypothetical protein